MKSRREKVIAILAQEFGAVGDKAERVAAMIVNVLEYKKRSTQQNNYFWPVVIRPLAEHIGEDEYSLYILLCSEFNTVIKDNGMKHIRHISENDWTTLDQEKFCEKIRKWAMEFHGFYIPLPNEESHA